MGISYALGNALLATQKYENWAEVLIAIAQRKEPARIILKDGLQITASGALRYLVRAIFYERIYNPAGLPIEQNDIVVDIGANCGVFTLFAATSTRNVIYAYEPSPENFAVLTHNITVNHLRHVITQCCAVSNKVGNATLSLNPRDSQLHVLTEQSNIRKIESDKLTSPLPQTGTIGSCIQVPTTTLQAIIEDHHLERIDFLKMDCEGSEGEILASTPVPYLRKIRKVALEFHDHLSPFSHTHLQKFLEGAGLTTRLRWNGHSPRGYIYAWRA
ncbi:MAG TPA: FkbM family methyltransferase [Ktedonobacteraceae bacterium]|nr:FkbM family methyltransferase [Ktedonobacteraceae bacterium]